MLEDVPEGFKIGVTAANDGVAKLEGGDVGLMIEVSPDTRKRRDHE